MKKGLVMGVIVAIVIILIIAGFYFLKPGYTQTPTTNTQTTPSQNPAPAATNTIFMQNFAFTPVTLNVKIGDSVTWTNEDSAPHKLASDSGSELASGSLSNGQSYSHTFNTAGTYNYHCAIHASMKGTVVVS
jgi:amicyanin